jgi:hypothetical protein
VILELKESLKLGCQTKFAIGASFSVVMVRNSTASANTIGISADRPGGITGNGTGLQATNSAQLQSYGNNNVGGSTTDGAATTTLALE